MDSIGLHIILVLAGYAAFLVAGGSGWIYLYQERQLKAKNPVLLLRPASSLEALDKTNLRFLWIGFLLFTFGVADGLRASTGRIGLTDPKTLFTFATWGAYAVLLIVRSTSISRGPKVAALSVLCLLLVGFTFVGVNMFLHTQHSFF
ncbi:MAG: cytochrome c biogenesis protein CcsA [Candidatus Omnitrophica bacterium]|nr:cytochrome c biogenesis protein CcsA [Candidatus Omnitrophota bacterium]